MPLLQFKFTKLSKIIRPLPGSPAKGTLQQPWPYRPTLFTNRQETWLLNEQETARWLTLLSPAHSWGTSNSSKFLETVKGVFCRNFPLLSSCFRPHLSGGTRILVIRRRLARGPRNHFPAAGLARGRALIKAADYSASKNVSARAQSQPTAAAVPASTARSSHSIAASGTPWPSERMS